MIFSISLVENQSQVVTLLNSRLQGESVSDG